jgi:hypothetical protein
MAVWLFESFATGFHFPTDEAGMQWFRIIFGLVCACRFVLALGHGGWDRFAPGSLGAHTVAQRLGPRRFHAFSLLYQPVLVARIIPAISLVAGVLPRLSTVLVVAGIAAELCYVRSPNSIRYAILLGACLFVAGNPGSGFLPQHHLSSANDWAQCLAVLITTDVYWNSAWHKARSPQFRSGRYLAQWVNVYTRLRDRLPYREHFVPALVRDRLGTLSAEAIATWHVLSTAVIGLEILIPPALLVPQTRTAAIVVGLGMHLCFTCLKPRQLITFTALAVGSYLLFAA